MQRGWITLTLAALLVVASATAVRAPELVVEPPRSFAEPPPLPLLKPDSPDERHAKASGGDKELRCLALTVYWESNSEPREGQLAVAHVVLNRVGRSGFADSICGVVHQGGNRFPCQFHWSCNGHDTTPKSGAGWTGAQQVARQAMAEADSTDGALYFHLASLDGPRTKGRRYNARVIGHHIFYRASP